MVTPGSEINTLDDPRQRFGIVWGGWLAAPQFRAVLLPWAAFLNNHCEAIAAMDFFEQHRQLSVAKLNRSIRGLRPYKAFALQMHAVLNERGAGR
jgi:hypothetical protein